MSTFGIAKLLLAVFHDFSDFPTRSGSIVMEQPGGFGISKLLLSGAEIRQVWAQASSNTTTWELVTSAKMLEAGPAGCAFTSPPPCDVDTQF